MLNDFSVGLFPDVGGSYFLPRLQGRLGYYLGLTGYRLKGKSILKLNKLTIFVNTPNAFIGQDVLHAGIATHYCESAKIPEIEKALLSLSDTKNVDNVINEFCPKPKSEFVLAKHLEQIDKSFNATSVEDVLSNLKADNSDWAQQTVKVWNAFLILVIPIFFL